MNIRILLILFLVFISCKNVTDKENEQQKVVVNFSELETKYSDLKTHFGEDNIQIDYYGDSFNKIRVTHIPTGKIQLGEKYNTQIKNAVDALENLKMELVSKSKLEIKSNSILVEFLENPIDLQSFKKLKDINYATTGVSNGKDYHFHPKIKDSIFYIYNYPTINFTDSKKNDQVVVFKHGINKQTYDDETEILIELRIFNKDADLGKANLIGLSKTELESEFGTDYLTLDKRIIYSNKNKVLILEIENSKIKSFNYIKLSTEKIDTDLIRKITE